MGDVGVYVYMCLGSIDVYIAKNDDDVDDSRPNDEPLETKSGRMIRPPKW